MAYKLYVWRKQMNMSYEQMELTPATIIFQDLEFMSLENKFNQPVESKE